MGCILSAVSLIVESLEKVSMVAVCTCLTCCLTFTLITMLLMGVGIGYHYCLVQSSLNVTAKNIRDVKKENVDVPKKLSQPESVSNDVAASVRKAALRGFAHRISRRTVDDLSNSTFNNNTKCMNGKCVSETALSRANGTVEKAADRRSFAYRLSRRAIGALTKFNNNTANVENEEKCSEDKCRNITTLSITNYSANNVGRNGFAHRISRRAVQELLTNKSNTSQIGNKCGNENCTNETNLSANSNKETGVDRFLSPRTENKSPMTNSDRVLNNKCTNDKCIHNTTSRNLSNITTIDSIDKKLLFV